MTIDECLAEVDDDKRNELERLRRIIKQVAPAAEDCISYAISAFRMKKILVGFGATLKHCAFYLFSGSIVGAHMDELKRFDISKGTILFLFKEFN